MSSRSTKRNLSARDDLFEDIARGAPTMLWVSDANGVMVFQNDQYLEFTGLTEQAAKSPNSWSDLVHPDDLDLAMNAYIRALKDQRSFSIEYRLKRHDGQFRDVLDTARPRLDNKGSFAGYVGSTLDISERKAHEKAVLKATNLEKKRSRDLNLLYELKTDLQVCREVEETRPVLTKYCEQLFPERSARILLHNNSRDLVEPFLDWGQSKNFSSEIFDPTECWALRKGKSHLEHPTSLGSMCPNARSCGHQNYLCIPMVAFGETVGIMQIDTAEELDPTRAEKIAQDLQPLTDLSTMAADEISAAIEELKLRAKLQHQSSRDPLTHLYNRRYFMEALERELYRAKHNERELSLLMIDLDYFKTFNDNHGHIGGDMVLREFGKVLAETTRGADIASRYGGEEFAVLMIDCPPDGARKRAEEIRRKTEKIAIEFHNELLEGISASIGLASFPANADSIDSIISAADEALYNAKSKGRNCVQQAGNTEHESGDEKLKAVTAT